MLHSERLFKGSIASLLLLVSTVAVAGSLMELNAGDVNKNQHSGDINIGTYMGQRINIDGNEIQSQNCSRAPCNNTVLYLQHEGAAVQIGGNGNSHLVLRNPDETEQRISFFDKQNTMEFATLAFNSGRAHSGLNLTISDDAKLAWFEFRPSGEAYKLGGGSWSTLSDERVKKNVEEFKLGLATLKKINPVSYQFNGKAGTPADGQQHVGVIAQDIQQIEELAGITLKREKKLLDMDDQKESELMTFDSSALLYITINAIKELQGEVEKLKAHNQELEKIVSARP